MSFYNTINETGKKLEQYQQKAESQEEKVLKIFRASSTGLTASEVFKLFPARNVPIGSIRRAITNLMARDRKLVKTNIKRPGIYGAPEHEYQLYTGQLVMFN